MTDKPWTLDAPLALASSSLFAGVGTRGRPYFELSNTVNGTATVIVRNPSNQSVTLTVPAHAVLAHPQLQDQMLLQNKPRTLTLAPKGQSQFRATTMCVGERKEASEGMGFQRW